MKKRNFVIGLVIAFILLATLTITVFYWTWINNLPSNNPLSLGVRVDGLQGLDSSDLQLFAELPQTREQLNNRGITLPTKKVRNGDYKIDISNLPDGTYILKISSPPQYFRNPAGYLFIIKNSEIMCSVEFPYHFGLVPESAQDLPPCRNIPAYSPDSLTSTPSSPTDIIQEVCMAEGIYDPCGPPGGHESQP